MRAAWARGGMGRSGPSQGEAGAEKWDEPKEEKKQRILNLRENFDLYF